MKFPWRKRRLPPPTDVQSAEDAVSKGRERKAEAEARWPLVRWLSGELQMHSDENHFTEMVTRAMRRRDA